jgi:Arylsulfotransferase (ASST)
MRQSSVVRLSRVVIALGLMAGGVTISGVARSRATPLGPTQSPAPLVAADPALYPAFAPRVPDYVVRCRGRTAVQVRVTAAPGQTVAIDGRQARGGSFQAAVPLSSGQAFPFAVTTDGVRRTYSVRCLPGDFPVWTSSRSGRPQAQWYVVAPCCSFRYVALFDPNGVPVWWLHTSRSVLDAGLLPDGNVDVALGYGKWYGSELSLARWEEYRLDGTLRRTFSIAPRVPTDRHQMLVLPNGDYILLAHHHRSGVDLSHYGGPAHATVLDAYVAEFSPHHKLLWSWDSGHHIGLGESRRWLPGLVTHPSVLPNRAHAYDIVHINSVAPDGRYFLVSLRHTDAIYAVDKATGHVVWKLGGTPTSASLTIRGDSVPDFGGQHDVRVLPDGTVTLFDNGTDRGRPPRALRFRIDSRTRTATLLEQITDPLVTSSPCCGSARELPGGDWVISWGGDPLVTEVTPAGTRVFTLDLQPLISFRAPPVPAGVLKRRQLNDAMSQMHPRLAR